MVPELLRIAQSLYPVMLFTALVTLTLAALLYSSARNIWVDERWFRVLGLFYGLNVYDSWRLALAWVRLLMTVFYLAAFRSLDFQGSLSRMFLLPQYAAYLIVGFLYILDFRKPGRIPRNILYFALLCSGLFLAGMVGDHMRDVPSPDLRVLLVYLFLGVLISLFALYLFLREAEEVSGDRKMDPEKDYRKSVIIA